MPLFNQDDTQQPTKVISPSAETDYKDVSVTLDNNPLNSILVSLDGSRWAVDYYRQLTTQDTGTGSHNTNSSALTQSYEKIIDFELRVTTPLSQSTTQQQETTLTGAGYTHAGFYPNKGDVFVAAIGPRQVQFEITEVERKSIMQQSAFEVTYQAIHDHTGEHEDRLEDKVVKTLNFVLDRLKLGKSPMMVSGDYAKIQSLGQWLHRLSEDLYYLCYSKQYSTLLVPEQPRTTYDPSLTAFILAVVSKTDHPKFTSVNVLNCDNTDNLVPTTVYDAILQRDKYALYNASKHHVLSIGSKYRQLATYGSVYYSGIDRLYYAADTIDKVGRKVSGDLTASVLEDKQYLYGGMNLDEDSQVAIKPVTEDNYYVFSQQFYDMADNLSLLEQLVIEYLDGEIVSIDNILALTQDTVTWGKVEKAYYLPIMIVLIRHVIYELG